MAACKHWTPSSFDPTVRPLLWLLQKTQVYRLSVDKFVSLLNPFGIYLFLLILQAVKHELIAQKATILKYFVDEIYRIQYIFIEAASGFGRSYQQ